MSDGSLKLDAQLAEKSADTATSSAADARQAWLEQLGRNLIRYRWPLLFTGHTVVFVAAYWMAFCLRFDFAVPLEYQARFFTSLPVVLGAKLAVFCALKSFHGWWRHVTFRDLVSLSRALIISFFVIVVLDYFFLSVWIPRSVLIMDTICAGILVGLARSSWRLAREGLWPGVRLPKDCTGALMISNNHESVMLAHQINSTSSAKYKIVGILTDERRLIGSTRAGIPVVGKPEDAQLVAPRYGATEVWSVAGGIPGARLRELKTCYESTALKIKIIPEVLNSTNENGQIPIRDIDIRDLLQRDPVVLDTRQLSEQLQGRRVMVTGAGGSIGSEICRQIARYRPSSLILVDHRENSVFLIHQELEADSRKHFGGLKGSGPATRVESHGEVLDDPSRKPASIQPTRFVPCVGDILDEARMRDLFGEYRPELVYHAAAHKHVGLMECNAGQAIKNNIFGTKIVADLAKEFSSDKFVLISTDKAVNPTSVMGVTKQIAERYINSLARESETTQFIVVRFGNVLGSNGSVVPIFKEQIANGGPITVTDERMTRFFMTIPEASQLVLQAAAMGEGGEIFVLEMGEQVKIIELARELIRLAGLPENAVDIQVIGARPGEKLYEELYFEEEQMLDTDHPKIHAAFHRDYAISEVLSAIESLKPYISQSNAEVRKKLKEIVPEFNWNPGTSAAASEHAISRQPVEPVPVVSSPSTAGG